MRKLKKILALGLVLALGSGILAGCGSANNNKPSDKADKKEEVKELKLGFDDSFPPMGFKDDSGEYTGFDIELAKVVSKDLGMKLTLVPINWDAKDADLESGNINCIWNGFTKTGREGKYAFSDVYMKNKQIFIVKEGSNIKSIADLKGKTLVVQKESTAVNALDAKKDVKESFKEVRELPENLTALMEVESKNADAVLLDEVVGRYWLRNNPDKKMVVLDESLADEEYAVGFKLGNDALAKKVSEGIKKAKDSGEYKKIYDKYFK